MAKIIICLYIFGTYGAFAQEPEAEVKLPPKGGEPGWEAPKQKEFSKSDISKACKKFNSKYISYYSQVYKIENCLRRELDLDSIEDLGKKAKVVTVGSDIIAMLPVGTPIVKTEQMKNCRELQGEYIISPSGDMYLMEKCLLRVFPDYESYEEHARKSKRKSILELTGEEFGKFKLGTSMITVFDAEYSKEPVVETEVDVIPLSEACAGINGKYVSYYSKIYHIEKCHKREITDENKLKTEISKNKVHELSSEQWISLPDGEEM